MATWTADKVRETFISFFQAKSHLNWKSSPVVPRDDPTLLFANAGMNQFKPIFLGTVDPATPLGRLTRACNSQKCIRSGVTCKDTYHDHTFFEMLGNWSFGDYFKEEAISWAWQLLTKVYKLPTYRIYATYFGGDEKAGLAPDEEAKAIWERFLPKERVLPFGCKDNFWEMGDTGPCGPCTQIHFDRVGNRDAASLLYNDDPTCIEIWNLVFIQYNREADGSLRPLPAKHVDTGMGFERLTSVLQNKMSNYDTDIFIPIFDEIQKATGAEPYSGKVGADDADRKDMAYRMLADHIRTLCFAIADGSRPGNEGREYVLRRILRRAVLYGWDVLKAPNGFFSRLVDVVVRVMGDVFPELRQHKAKIEEIIKEEEESFGRTLAKGKEKFEKAVQDVQGNILSGQEAFILWDTYGFPLDLTQLMAEERKLSVDVNGFNAAMEEARQKARNARNKVIGESIAMDAEATSQLRKSGVNTTDDSHKFIWHKDHESVVKAIYTGSEFVEVSSSEHDVGIVFESTSFYAEQGGQIFDTGAIEGPFGSFKVTNVQVYGGYVLHIGSISQFGKPLSVGDNVTCKVDYARRTLIAPNHTCTHLLNFALREVLGDHIDQKGSIVLPEKLRFDFSHGKPVSPEDLKKIEIIINKQIKDELDVYAQEVSLASAKRINGLRAVFGEIYPDPVRVVSIGQKVDDLLSDPQNKEWLYISTELCGGTHISNTREAKAFTLLQEKGIAEGVRRITAVTTECAFKAMELASSFYTDFEDIVKTETSTQEKKVASLKSRIDAAAIPAATKADLSGKISKLENQMGSCSNLPLAGPENFPVLNCNRFPENFPMLLVPFGRNDSGKRPYLYNIINRRAYNCFSESIFHDKWIPGSTRGWLVTVDKMDKSINLLNPLTTRQISLPATFHEPVLYKYHREIKDPWYVRKAVILFDTSGKPEDSVIVAIVTSQRRLCFCRVGDDKWTNVKHSPVGVSDIINIGGILWAVTIRNCGLFAVVIGRRCTRLTMIVGRSPLEMLFDNNYLVESCGGLLLVCRGTRPIDDERSQTNDVRVFTMVRSVSKYLSSYQMENLSYRTRRELQYEWVEVESIGKQMIFLGYNHSLSVDFRAYYPGCRGNHVYIADHLFDTDLHRFFFGSPDWHDICVYHLQNKRIKFLKGLGELPASNILWFSPSW